MMSHRTAVSAHHRARPAVEPALEHLGPSLIGEEPELADGRAEECDDRCTDARRHVHDAGVTRYDKPRVREERAGLLQRQGSGDVDRERGEGLAERPVIRASHGHDRPPTVAQPLCGRTPARERPAFGEVRGTGCQYRERLPGQPLLTEPLLRPAGRCLTDEELRRAAVGPDIQVAGGLEIALGDRHRGTVKIDLGRDEYAASELAFGVATPGAANEHSQGSAAQRPVQVESPRRREGGEAPRERPDRFAGLQRYDVRQVRVVRDEWSHGVFRDEDELRVGVAGPQHSHERGGQQDVADGGEADEEETRHAKKV